MKDLQSDKKEFFRYTLKRALGIELLTENHLADLLALSKYVDQIQEFKERWKDVDFCKGCISAHCLELQSYGSECLTSQCPAQPEWRELARIADELYDFIEPLEKPEQYNKEVFDKVTDFSTRLRDVRKRLEEAGKGVIVLKDDGKEHLT